MTSRTLTPDAQVTLLLSSHLSMPKGPAGGKLQPLSPAEWNDLASLLLTQKLRPGALLSWDASALQGQLGLSAQYAERVHQLLARGVQLAIEIERLSSLGIWVLTRADAEYPAILKERLGSTAPPVLFGAGNRGLLSRGFLAVVGSRDVDEAGAAFAGQVGSLCAREDHVVVSGGARGVDRLSMAGALQAGGLAIGVLADSLERVVREPEYREAMSQGRLVLISHAHPKAPFNVANAMARNKFIYCLAQYGLVVSASQAKGGTRAGAMEVLKQRWVPLFVRTGEAAPAGNVDLVKQGGLPFGPELLSDGLAARLQAQAAAWTQSAAVPNRRTLREGPKLLKDPASSQSPPRATDDLFPVVWPHIAQRLRMWRTARELAGHLNVEIGQVQAWLKRAQEEGLATYEQASGEYSPASGGGGQIRLDI